MKTFLKYLITFAVILALSATFMANTHKTETNTKAENPPPCWITINVDLLGDCVYVNDSTSYYVNLKIYNVCNDPSTPIYDETKSHPSEDGNSFGFCIGDTLCVSDIVNNCFKVIVTAVKKNTINDVIVCDGINVQPATNCEGLMNYDTQIINVTLE